MFTGIIEEVGRVAELATDPLGGAAGGRLRIEAAKLLEKISVGSSVAVSGCCLTVTEKTDSGFACDLSPETLARTGFRRLRAGAEVNLEAPLTLSTPLGGHLVQGHVEATGTFVELRALGDGNYDLQVDVPAELTRYLVEKGSVAVEGISLTVAAMEGARLGVAIIPFTYENTNLRSLQPGDPVNLEFDVLAKYVEKLLADSGLVRSRKPPSSKLTLDRLRDEGF
ncbi:MAG: riboflavin synthase [Acidobacteria bacterium]|nr:riboflavin synthase [Acidobacteriota bacterium]